MHCILRYRRGSRGVGLQQTQYRTDFFGENPTPKSIQRPTCTHSITHAIYPTLAINGHAEQICPMLIVPPGNHRIIIGRSWMNKRGVILDMKYD